jgi:hypothetical protein
MDRLRSPNCPRPWRTVLLAVVLGAALAGCGSGQAEVSGTVRYNGKPLTHGTIQFLGPDGIPYAGTIQADGTFCVRVPVGQAKVIVSCVDESKLNRLTSKAAGSQNRTAPASTSAASLSLIPQRYADWNASGLTVLVKSGQTVQDIALTSQ